MNLCAVLWHYFLSCFDSHQIYLIFVLSVAPFLLERINCNTNNNWTENMIYRSFFTNMPATPQVIDFAASASSEMFSICSFRKAVIRLVNFRLLFQKFTGESIKKLSYDVITMKWHCWQHGLKLFEFFHNYTKLAIKTFTVNAKKNQQKNYPH